MNFNTSISISVQKCIEQAILDTPINDQDFNTLALGVFAYQYQENRAYQKFCHALGQNPDLINHWHDIPALPTDAFKMDSYPLTTFPVEEASKTFRTSGTTTETRGLHHFTSTKLYDQSIITAWNELNLPDASRSLFLIPHPDQSPQSSLSHMMGVISKQLAEQSTWLIDESGSINLNSLISTIKNQQANQSVALFGTALSFLHLFDSIESPIKLPEGSWAMETGGYKGTNRQLSKDELYRQFGTKLGLPSDSIINEYSMTELSSQFYSHGLDQPHKGPSWTRTRIIDPITNTDAKLGKLGHLVIYDLANVDSVMAIRTQDLAIQSQTSLEQTGSHFNLIGRDPSALPRGCSRSSDESLSS